MRVGRALLAGRSPRCRRRLPGLICRRRLPSCVTPNDSEVTYYIDTSALVKLVVAEPETAALRAWLGEAERNPVGCDLLRTELLRAVRRAAPDRAVRARAVLDALTLVQVTTAMFEAAGRLEPATMRSLDAIHVAVALDLGDELDGFVTYDERLAAAAEGCGVLVVAPT